MGEGSYFNFDLIVERAGENYRARVFDSPAGQASTEFESPFSALELENFVLRMGRPRSGVRRVDSSEMEAVKGCGERLFRAVFKDDVYAAFLRSRDNALEEGQGLRVRLRIDAPEFHDYPWEYLYNAHLNQFLALSRETPVVRYLELPYPVQPLTVQPPLKILVMISSPEGFPQLQVEEEWKRLSNALAPLARCGLVTLERLKKPTLSALQQHLRRGEYHIFHFIGHGKYSEHKQDGMLLLEEEGGQGRPVSGQYMGTVLHDHRSLRLVVLNACEGARTSQEDPYAGVAQTLVLQGIPAVIAMQFEILETAAITFAQEFYGALADGFPVDAAVSEARKAIFAAGNDVEWGTPVLYMRTPQGVIFEIPEAQRVKHPLSDEPISYVDKELEQKLEGLYTEGLAAFWVEDWDRACDRFKRILTDRPDHAAASAKLAEANRQRQLSVLYARAFDAQKTGDWVLALQTLEELQKDSPNYRDAGATLKIVKKQKQLADLYAEAKKLHAAQKWQAVAKVFEQIHSIDSAYPDPENLLPTAEKELAELKRQAELKELYCRAVRAMDAGQWEEAQNLLRQVQEKEASFLETERLLSKAEAKVRQSEAEKRKQDQVNTLYEQAHGLLRSKKWRKALDKIEEIRKLDEQFDDPEKIAEQAKKELAREEQEAERQSELAAMYADAVRLLREEKYQEALKRWQEIKATDPKYPDRQRIQRTTRKILAGSIRPAIPDIDRLSIEKVRIEWFVLLAAIGFGFARYFQQNLGLILRLDVPGEFGWALRGAIDGLIAVILLRLIVTEWKWQAILTFAICWSAIYFAIYLFILNHSTLILTSLAFSLAPSVSVIISSICTRKWRRWPDYLLIFIGWVLAWTLGSSIAVHLLGIYDYKWMISDVITGGIGLWITGDLLRATPKIFMPSVRTGSILVSLLVILVAGVYLYRASLDPFAGAIGEWESTDFDGSFQTLSINRMLSGKYVISYRDKDATFCNGGPGMAETSANTNSNVIHAPYVFRCDLLPYKVGHFEMRLAYDADIDQLVSSSVVVWHRIR